MSAIDGQWALEILTATISVLFMALIKAKDGQIARLIDENTQLLRRLDRAYKKLGAIDDLPDGDTREATHDHS